MMGSYNNWAATQENLSLGFATADSNSRHDAFQKALIRLRGCTGWSAPVLFANPKDRFSHDGAHI